jgi:hypothetical protein
MHDMKTRTLRCALLLLSLVALNVFGQGKEKASPEHSNVEIRVTYLKPGDIRHFTTDATVAPGAQATFRCGRVGNLCEISWLFMERSEFGDVYKFSRVFPQAKDRQSSQREVLYMGRETLIWQDEDQRVTIKPRPPLEP